MAIEVIINYDIEKRKKERKETASKSQMKDTEYRSPCLHQLFGICVVDHSISPATLISQIRNVGN